MTKERLAQILRMISKQDLSGGVCWTLYKSALSSSLTYTECDHVKCFLFHYFSNPQDSSDIMSYWLNQKGFRRKPDGAAYRKQLLLDAADFVEVTGIVE